MLEFIRRWEVLPRLLLMLQQRGTTLSQVVLHLSKLSRSPFSTNYDIWPTSLRQWVEQVEKGLLQLDPVPHLSSEAFLATI